MLVAFPERGACPYQMPDGLPHGHQYLSKGKGRGQSCRLIMYSRCTDRRAPAACLWCRIMYNNSSTKRAPRDLSRRTPLKHRQGPPMITLCTLYEEATKKALLQTAMLHACENKISLDGGMLTVFSFHRKYEQLTPDKTFHNPQKSGVDVAVPAMTLSKTNFSTDPFQNLAPPGGSKSSFTFNKLMAVTKLYFVGHCRFGTPMADEYCFVDRLKSLS